MGKTISILHQKFFTNSVAMNRLYSQSAQFSGGNRSCMFSNHNASSPLIARLSTLHTTCTGTFAAYMHQLGPRMSYCNMHRISCPTATLQLRCPWCQKRATHIPAGEEIITFLKVVEKVRLTIKFHHLLA